MGHFYLCCVSVSSFLAVELASAGFTRPSVLCTWPYAPSPNPCLAEVCQSRAKFYGIHLRFKKRPIARIFRDSVISLGRPTSFTLLTPKYPQPCMYLLRLWEILMGVSLSPHPLPPHNRCNPRYRLSNPFFSLHIPNRFFHLQSNLQIGKKGGKVGFFSFQFFGYLFGMLIFTVKNRGF